MDTASKGGQVFDETASATFLCNAPPPPPPATGSIVGTITDSSNGNAIQGASVSSDGQSDTTDAAGSYTLPNVSTGSQTVSVSAGGYESASQPTTVSEGLTSPVDISLTPTPVGGGTGALKGTVTNADGAKLNKAQIQVIGGPGASTNKGGKYTVQNVPEGLQTVIVSHPDHGDSSPVQVTIPAGVTVTLNIIFDP